MNKQAKKSGLDYYLRIFAVGLIAFVGTYGSSPRFGVLSSLPLLFLAAAAVTAIQHSFYEKLALFLLFAAFFSFTGSNYLYAALFTLLAGGSLCALEGAKKLFTEKATGKAVFAAVLILLPLAGSWFLQGNIFSALAAERTFRTYTAEQYTDSVAVSGTYYDFETGAYTVRLTNKLLPGGNRTVTIRGGTMQDNFLRYAELQNMNSAYIKLVSTIRQLYPDDLLRFESVGITGFPSKKPIDPNGDDTNGGKTEFEIYIVGAINLEDFVSRAEKYTTLLQNKNVPFGKLTFYMDDTKTGTVFIEVTDKSFLPGMPAPQPVTTFSAVNIK